LKIFLYIISLSVLLLACSSDKTNDYKPKEPIREVQFINQIKSISELFKESGYIILDSNKEAIIPNHRISKFIDSIHIFVSDLFSIRVFEKNGKFVQKIEKKGDGPGEYKSLINVTSSSDVICGYDNSTSSIYLFNFKTGALESTFKVKNRYRQICIYKDSLIIMLRQGSEKDKYCIFDFYNTKGNILYTDTSIEISDPRQYVCMPNGNIILEVYGKYMYFISPDNLIIRCYNITERKVEWCSNYLPNVIALEKINNKSSVEKVQKWINDYEMLYGFMILESKLLLLQTKNYIMFYDANGNYLNHFRYRGAYSNLKWFSPFSDGHSIYQLNQPDIKKISLNNSNYRLVKYDFLFKK